MSKLLHVLIVEDSESDAAMVVRLLRRAGYDVRDERVETADEMRAALERQAWDVVICDYRLPQFDAPAALALLQGTGLDIPFIVVSGTIGEDTAVAMMKAGAHDYLLKDKLMRLAPAVEREIREAQTRRERQRVEAALRESETRYRALFESARDAIFIMDDDRFIDCNLPALRLFGGDQSSVIGQPPYEVFSPPVQPDGRPSKDSALEKIAVALSGVAQFFEWKHRRMDGALFDAEVSLSRVEISERFYLQAIVRDITERKRMEESLREAELRYRTFFEQSADGILIIDPETAQVIEFNNAAHRQLGYTRDEFARLRIPDYEAVEKPGETKQHIEKIRREGRDDFETKHRTKGGEIRDVFVTVQMVELAGRAVLYAIFRDITERKRAEEAIQQAEARYRNLFEEAPLMYVITSNQGGVPIITDCNQSFWSMLGYAQAELVGRPLADLYTPQSRAMLLEGGGYAHALVGPFVIEERQLVARDGHIVEMLLKALPEIDREGRAIGTRAMYVDITERKRAEAALRVSEERFALAVQGSNDGVWDWDIKNGTLYWSPHLKELLGYAEDELDIDFDTFDSLLHPADKERVAAAIEAHLKDRVPYDVEERHRTKSGGYRWFRARGQALWDETGNPVRMVGFTTDITERKQMETALRESEKRYRDIFENATEGIFQSTLEGRFITVNPAFARMLGYASPEEMIATVTDIARQVYMEAPRGAEFMRLMAEQGSASGFELQMRRKDGGTLWVSENARAVRDADGRILYYGGTAEDITPRKYAEQQVTDALRYNHTIIESSPVGIVTCNASGQVVSANPAIAETVGGTLEQILAQNVFQLPSWQQSGMLAAARAALTTGHEQRLETHTVSTFGKHVWFDCHFVPFQYQDEPHLLALLTDITERKRVEEDIQRHALHLATLNEIGQAITSTLDLDRSLGILLDGVTRATNVEACSVALVDADTGDLVFRKAAGLAGWPVIGMRVKVGQGVAGWVAEHRQPLVVEDAASDLRFYEQIDATTGFATRNVVSVPLVARDRVIGVIELINKRDGTFDQDDIQLLTSVASQAAVALENARLFETERRARQRFEMLFGVGQAINSTLDAAAILDRLTDEAMRATRATHGSAIIARTDLERFDRCSLRGYTPDQAERARSIFLPLDRGLNGRAYRTRQTVYLPDVRADPDYFALIPETRSELVVPILRSGQVLANLDLQSPQLNAFDDMDAELLQALVNQVAIALENARLFEDTRRRLDEMAIVSQVALIGAAGRPFDEAVSRAVDGMCRLWPDSNVSFLFLDDTGQVLRLHPASQGVSPELIADFQVPLNQGITGWAARERQPVRVGDVTLDPRYIVGMTGARSEMVAPLLVGERAIGVINVECPWPNSYSGDDLRVLTALASQLATIFEKSRLDAEVAAYTATLEQRVQERTAEIRRQQARTQAILDALGEGVIVADLSGSVEYVNASAQILTGFNVQEALGNNPRLWQSGQTPQAVYQEMWGAILQGQTWRGEIVNRRKDGALYDAGLTIAPIPHPDSADQIVGFVGVQRDISFRKRAEAEVRRALEQEKELSELKSRFISMASHEFRTPLTTILSSTEMLQVYGARWTEERKLTHLQRIKASVLNMTRLLDDVLILGRVEAGRMEFNPAPLDLVEFCRELIEEMQLGAGPKHVLELVSQVECAQANLDEKLLRHILTNLLSNAIKYSPDGGAVQLELACQAGRAIFQVRDHGIGIPETDQARLFEAFHRAKNVGNISGTGLGLAIVKKSVDAHGGTIAFASQVGQGTMFTVTLPMENGT